MIEIKPTLIKFYNGIRNVSKCMEDIVWTINCTKICYPLHFNYLAKIPDCRSYKDLYCMNHNGFWYHESAFGECLRPHKAMIYKAKTILRRPVLNSTVITTWFKFSTNQLEIKEEVPSLDLSSFLGTVGGSLSLFLGFSCYSYFTLIVDNLLNLFQN